MKRGKVVAISLSEKKGTPKRNVKQALLVNDFGLVGDAHAGSGRQVSLLPIESIRKVKERGLDVKPGDFADNITVMGIDFSDIKIGDKIRIGKSVELEVIQRGKTCHSPCWIYNSIGDCIMPKEGIFARVIRGGFIRINDEIEVISSS
jgi:MOSC domain-containing protein YiiM